jgi:hypothetical protein
MNTSYIISAIIFYVMVCSEAVVDQPVKDSVWSSILAEQAYYSDLSLFYIGVSKIHGRGVFLSRDIKKGEKIGLGWHDFYFTDEACNAASTLSMEKRGYISDGGTIKVATMTLEEALSECNSITNCMGITYQNNPEKISCLDGINLQCKTGVEIFNIDFKNHNTFAEDKEWRSYIKPSRHVAFHPLSCNGDLYPNGEDRVKISNENALACWPRWVNHECNASVTYTFQYNEPGSTESDSIIPGIPWAVCSRAVHLVALRDLRKDEEVTLNYELNPSYLLRYVDGVENCFSNQV